jgi:hydroxymethylpyrimidine pyrophosphatase-like HAD family hydrolase
MLAAVDLDRTLIYSQSAWMLPDDPEHPPAQLLCVEEYDGSPLSYLTRAAARLLPQLDAMAVFVPVTTRTQEQFARVRLPSGPTRFAITTNGARLLVDGAEDLEWSRTVVDRIAGACAPLDEIAAHLGAQPAEWLLRLRDAEQAFCYAIIDRDAAPAAELDALRAWCAERGWTVSVQGRKLYCVPDPLTKTAAVAEVARRSGATVVAAAGDSLLDAGMLAAADMAIRPAHGELEAAGWSPPGVEVTEEAGVLAGERIVAWLLSKAIGTGFSSGSRPD